MTLYHLSFDLKQFCDWRQDFHNDTFWTWHRFWGRWLWLMGALAIATHYIATYAMQTWATAHFVDIFSSHWLNWLGLNTRKPITQDFVPVLPWLGVMWWGVALGVNSKAVARRV